MSVFVNNVRIYNNMILQCFHCDPQTQSSPCGSTSYSEPGSILHHKAPARCSKKYAEGSKPLGFPTRFRGLSSKVQKYGKTTRRANWIDELYMSCDADFLKGACINCQVFLSMPPGSQHSGNNSFCCVLVFWGSSLDTRDREDWMIWNSKCLWNGTLFNSTILSNYLGPFRHDYDHPTIWCWWKSNSIKWYGRLPRCSSARFLTCSGTETNC